MRVISFSALLTLAVAIPSANAEITVLMDGWDQIPRVQVSKGNAQDCGSNPVVFDGPMSRGQVVGKYADAGSSGLDICWRRTIDPLQNTPDFGIWTRCPSDGTCIIS